MEMRCSKEMCGQRQWCLHTDILIDILSRVDTKDLYELKSVSKEWYKTISDRPFIKLLLNNKEPISGFFFQERYQWCDEDIRGLSYIPLRKDKGGKVTHLVLGFLPEDVSILSASHGLICCRSCMPTPVPSIYICNPLTKDWVSIKWTDHDINDSLVLAFDPLRNPIDISTKFKVVKVHQVQSIIDEDGLSSKRLVDSRRKNWFQLDDDDDDDYVHGIKVDSYFSFQIYSSETRNWLASNETCHSSFNLIQNRKGVYIGGSIHWLTDTDQILTFDVENELSWILNVPFPTTGFETIPGVCIGESEGNLYYIMVFELGLFAFALEDYYESKWVLEFSITLENLEKENPRFLYHTKERVSERKCIDDIPWIDPLAFKDGVLFMRVSTNEFLYHFKTLKMVKLCGVSELGTKTTHSPMVLPYTMSLIPLGNSGN